MEIKDERLIPGSLEATWQALNDPEVLKECIRGCESLERDGDDGFIALVALKVGPVSARFKGRVKLTNVQAPHSYTINFDGQGGVAGFAHGSADVDLRQEGEQTCLKYNARAQVGGKMAQMGSRLIDATVQKLTDDFFNSFEQHLRASNTEMIIEKSAPMQASMVEENNSSSLKWWAIAAVVLMGIGWYIWSI